MFSPHFSNGVSQAVFHSGALQVVTKRRLLSEDRNTTLLLRSTVHTNVLIMERREHVVHKGAMQDLVLLETVSEDAIMASLAASFKQDVIYVFIGPVLISLNPFKGIRGLYSPALLRKYTGRYMWEQARVYRA